MKSNIKSRKAFGGDELFFKCKKAVLRLARCSGVWGGRQSGAVDSGAEVVRGFGEGFGIDDHHIRFIIV